MTFGFKASSEPGILRLFAAVLVSFAVLTAAGGAAFAEEPAWVQEKEEQARQLIREANAARQAAIEAGDSSSQAWARGFREAAALLREIVAEAPSARRLYGLAFALFHLDEVERAHLACSRLEQDYLDDEKMLRRCEALMAVLHDVVFRVDVRSEPQGARVTVDGWGPLDGIIAPGDLWLREGRHTVRFTLEGYVPHTQEVVVERGFVTQVRGKLEEEPEPGQLELRTSPAGARVTIDGQPVELPMDGVVEVLEGEHVLGVSMDGFLPVEQKFTIVAHKLLRHTVKLREIEEDDPYLRGFPGGEPVVERKPASPYKVGGWTAIGLGAAALATGGVMHGLAFLDADEAESIPNLPGRRADFEQKRDDAHLKEVTAYALYGTGAAIVATGIVLLVVDPGNEPDETVVVPTAMGPDGAGLFVTGRF